MDVALGVEQGGQFAERHAVAHRDRMVVDEILAPNI